MNEIMRIDYAPYGYKTLEIEYDDATRTLTKTLEPTKLFGPLSEPRVEKLTYSLFDAIKAATNLNDAAARFICDWYPEYGYIVAKMAFYTISLNTFMQVDDAGLNDFLNFWDFDSIDAAETAGACIIQDAAFSGYIIEWQG